MAHQLNPFFQDWGSVANVRTEQHNREGTAPVVCQGLHSQFPERRGTESSLPGGLFPLESY